MKLHTIAVATGVAMLALIGTTPVFADTKAEINVSVSEALKQFNMLDSKHEALESRAAGLLVFPHVTKAGAGVAGEFGEGVLQVKGKTVGYYKVTSASVGLTLGVAKHSEIIMFMTQETLDKFTTSKGWSIGADTGVALMSKGAGADYDSKTLQRPILGFVFGEKGLIADLSLEGSKVTKLKKLK
jgi:lipid-binding SYLF domain-containing protein